MSRSRLHFAALMLAGVSGIGLSMTLPSLALADRQDKSRTGSHPSKVLAPYKSTKKDAMKASSFVGG